MKKILAALVLVALSGCVMYPAYEPPVLVNGYYVGYYDPAFGYWTGYGWDINFYAYGHRGYGHRYYGGGRGYYHHR